MKNPWNHDGVLQKDDIDGVRFVWRRILGEEDRCPEGYRQGQRLVRGELRDEGPWGETYCITDTGVCEDSFPGCESYADFEWCQLVPDDIRAGCCRTCREHTDEVVGGDGAGGGGQPGNVRPVAVVSSSAETIRGGSGILLDGSMSYDDDDDELTYEWRQTAGPDSGFQPSNAPTLTVATPTVPSTSSIEFELVVSDGHQSSEPALVTIVLRPSSTGGCRVSLRDGRGGAAGQARDCSR